MSKVAPQFVLALLLAATATAGWAADCTGVDGHWICKKEVGDDIYVVKTHVQIGANQGTLYAYGSTVGTPSTGAWAKGKPGQTSGTVRVRAQDTQTIQVQVYGVNEQTREYCGPHTVAGPTLVSTIPDCP